MQVYQRRLPHWDVVGQPLFVTFRLRDTLPPNRIFPPERMSDGRTFVAMDRFLDAGRIGPTFLKQAEIAQIVWQSIKDGEHFGRYDVHAFVIMPNHVHLLVTPYVTSRQWLGPLKGFTGHTANKLLGRSGAFWQDESYDHLVRNDRSFHQIRQYIEWNPVHAGLATAPDEFPWSSAAPPEKAAAAPKGWPHTDGT
jgi:putative DNA methylase